MYIGTDLGTPGVKVILPSEQGDVVTSKAEKLIVSRPRPLWSEQGPEQWQLVTDRVVKALGQQHSFREVRALGIVGQMYGVTLLDEQQKVLCLAILWNNGCCAEEYEMLESQVPQSHVIIGNLIMPGSIIPELLWVQHHEPEISNQIDKVLLPKDYLRLHMIGDFAGDISDAAETMWLDVAKRDRNDVMLVVCKLARAHMPVLYEGSKTTKALLPDVAKAWGMQEVAVATGGGDNTAGMVGIGMMNAGQVILLLGVPGVYFVVSDSFPSKPESAVHSFCHALLER